MFDCRGRCIKVISLLIFVLRSLGIADLSGQDVWSGNANASMNSPLPVRRIAPPAACPSLNAASVLRISCAGTNLGFKSLEDVGTVYCSSYPMIQNCPQLPSGCHEDFEKFLEVSE
ncbi:unnamed protein product [Cuscuta europaea]|uniref:Uncharacterized protein n=1 Tax=Cuscuta europaea TaxID=41803 RepID=A0A9P1EMN0_CUSEU|nr:unnamed protein product [Cuscuta europaea]